MKKESTNFSKKKVLVMGLGKLGGGVATTKWLVKHGAHVTVTDMRTREELKESITQLGSDANKIHFTLGSHDENDFKQNEFIVVNPAVPKESTYLKIAKETGNTLINDTGIFFNIVKNLIIAVTGTRGKTTTTNWIAHFLRAKQKGVVAGGNTPTMPLLLLIDCLMKNEALPAVLELSSWQLEFLSHTKRSPDISVITNIFPDHLNRYGSIKEYAKAKAHIFLEQNKNQTLILNRDNSWTQFFLDLKPQSCIFFTSLRPLLQNENGLFLDNGALIFQKNKKTEILVSKKELATFSEMGEHNLYNLLSSVLVAHLFGIPKNLISKNISSLPQIQFRQEVIFKNSHVTVVNDSAGTSPDATIAAIARFKDTTILLVSGGTDKNLRFSECAKYIQKYITLENLFLLEGSGTKKLLTCFKKNKPSSYENLDAIIKDLKRRVQTILKEKNIQKITILFSPGCASFEKFQNEFDRGRQFTAKVKPIIQTLK